ncbi:MAG: DUF5606 domain-containing protein [Bacteroidales bacterium]|nr:DUF5606 domain-containing protein [Bacteroidales bacterium]
MTKRILSISGKPGLYSLVSQGKNMLIVEDIKTGKRMPAYAHDKVMSLGDIAIYTTDEDKPLYDVFEAIKEKNNGQTVDLKVYDTPVKLREYFGEIVPDFDKDRVYNTDIKKVFQWYNLLVSNGINDFKDEEIAEDESAEASDKGTADAAATYESEKKDSADK